MPVDWLEFCSKFSIQMKISQRCLPRRTENPRFQRQIKSFNLPLTYCNCIPAFVELNLLDHLIFNRFFRKDVFG